jgi:hypothetical protein
MKARLIPLLLFLIMLINSGCTLVITPPPPPETVPNGVIFTPDQTKANLDVIGNGVEDAWTPSAGDVAKLDAALPDFLANADNPFLDADPPMAERLPDYMRQYLGIVENGEKLIFANYFCTINDMDWHKEYVFVLDGGDCFFQVKFNPATGEFSDLSVNGPG